MLGDRSGPGMEERQGHSHADERFDPHRRPWDADERSYAGVQWCAAPAGALHCLLHGSAARSLLQ